MATEPFCAVEGPPTPTRVPYRVLNKDYLSQQLPQLQERAPKSQKVNVSSKGRERAVEEGRIAQFSKLSTNTVTKERMMYFWN